MEQILYILTMTLPLAMTILFLGIFALWFNTRKKLNIIRNKGIIMGRFDLNRRKYMFNFEENIDEKIFKDSVSKKWMSFSNILNKFNESNKLKIIKSVQKLENGSEKEIVSFTVKHFQDKHSNTLFTFEFHKTEKENNYIFIIHFQRMDLQKNKEHFVIKETSIQEISKHSHFSHAFIIFNIVGDLQVNSLRLIKITTFLNIPHGIKYMIYKGKLIFHIHELSNRKTKKFVEKFINEIKNKGFNRGLQQLFSGSAVATTDKKINKKMVVQIIQTLEYLIKISIDRKEPFVTPNTEIDELELKKFLSATKVFSKTLNSYNIETINHPVHTNEKKNKIVDYYSPGIKTLNTDLLSDMLKNIERKENLTNKFFEKKCIINKEDKKPFMIDVGDDFLINNIDKIKNKKAMLVINFKRNRLEEEKIELLNKLNDRKLSYAFKVSGNEENFLPLTTISPPQFIVIQDTAFNSEGLINPDTYMRLMALKNICDKHSIKMIYENPTKLLDKNIMKNIGMKYYYHREKAHFGN